MEGVLYSDKSITSWSWTAECLEELVPWKELGHVSASNPVACELLLLMSEEQLGCWAELVVWCKQLLSWEEHTSCACDESKKIIIKRKAILDIVHEPLPKLLIWDIHGPNMEMVWDNLWVMCGCYMAFIWDDSSHIEPIIATISSPSDFYCLSLWDFYVFRKVPYISHRIWYGNDMDQSHRDTIWWLNIHMGLLRIS